jgi:hypothetical protein
MKDILNIGQALGRSEMKKLMAGSGGSGSCYYCVGGIHCYPSETGKLGKTFCTDNGPPNYGCSRSGSSCVGQ